MIFVRKRVDHRNVGIPGEILERFLREHARHDAVHPAFEIFGDVAHRFALAEMRERVVEKHRRAAQAGDADFESHARAQRRLLEYQRQKFARERGAIAFRAAI